MLGIFGGEKRNEITRNSMLYILSRSKNIDGRIKLMKLMFLLEHYDTKKNKITLEKRIGNDFVIYRRGVFSFDVYNEFLKLVNEGHIKEDSNSIVTNLNINKVQEKIPQEILKDLDVILSHFGNKSGPELEILTLKMLNLEKEDKEKCFGMPVESIILRLC